MSLKEDVQNLLTEKRDASPAPQTRYAIRIDGEDYTKYIPMPIKWSALLDERLDEGTFSLRNTDTPLFQPMTTVDISIMDPAEVYSYLTFLVSSDESIEVPPGSGKYNHELSLIEETKKLEGIIVDPITYTNDLGRMYTNNAKNIVVSVVEQGNGGRPEQDKINQIKESLTPKPVGSAYTFISLKSLFSGYASQPFYQWNTARFKVKLNDVYLRDYEETHNLGELPSKLNDEPLIVSSLKNGYYTVEYYLNFNNGGDVSVKYEFATVANQDPLPKWNITTVIERLLDLAEPHLKSERPKYMLNAKQAAQFSKIESPEFAFSKCTLKEALDQIGGYIHGIPRLESNVIRFDMLGGTEEAELSNPQYPYIENRMQQNIESYATKLDSTVDNMVNILDSDEGVITEPYIRGYKTVRSEQAYAEISDGNMTIVTNFPIQAVTKLEVGPLPDGSTGDITPYVFEAADYGRMSSYDGQYPSSKAFAVYYTQGQPNIKGLSFKSPNVTGGAGSKYSIANIIKEVTGYNLAGNWSSDYPKLSFRITYTPIFSARVEQHKLYYPEMHPRTLAYNQSANLIETRYYGENLRGAIARIGNPEIIRTYRLKSTLLIPKVGQAWGDYYVSSVDVALYPYYVDCTVGLSKDFNRLSQYIGINSMLRMYEVSEKQAYNRDIAYADYCVIGDSIESDTRQLFETFGQFDIVNTFYQLSGVVSEYPISAAGVTTMDDGLNTIANVTLPVISTAMGNSIVFSFYFDDNFSAGEKSVKGTSGGASGYWQTNVPYCDYYGRFTYMQFYLAKIGINPGFDWDVGYELPQGLYGLGETDEHGDEKPIYTQAYNPLVVRKNNTEIIRMNYQLHYVTNRKTIVTGPALTHNCPLVRGIRQGHSAILYVMPRRIGKFDSIVDIGNATVAKDYSEATGITIISKSTIKFDSVTAPVSGEAWAVVDKITNELLMGENVKVTAGEEINLPTFTLTHKIYKGE